MSQIPPAASSARARATDGHHAHEVARGERFEFGRNWASFLRVLNDERIANATESFRAMLSADLTGLRLLDAGSGSGLSSLVARRLGADVVSFDYDPASVACTRELRRRYFGEDPRWRVEQGSVLDPEYLQGLGIFDVVYSWGVLHHTGDMWRALDLVAKNVKPGGWLFVAIYNDQGAWSKRWWRIKKLYNSGAPGRAMTTAIVIPYWFLRQLASDLIQLRDPRACYGDYARGRGMSILHDWTDWLGGFPFEVAMPEQIMDFYHERGFTLRKMTTSRGSVGCNQFVFQQTGDAAAR
jgi:2-polyprenyl-6-hydroxyphenyl methylase/3-demethylubiquinone-9 3-methyltransferase